MQPDAVTSGSSLSSRRASAVGRSVPPLSGSALFSSVSIAHSDSVTGSEISAGGLLCRATILWKVGNK
jgi:hypothetical protein